MEIEYLIKMKNTPKIGRWENRGISKQQIEKLEHELNVQFPKAYKEFLFLGGKDAVFMGDWTSDYQYLDWIQTNIKESMNRVELYLRPFFIFGEYGRDQALFFFLDEGEPPPRLCL